MSTNFDWANYLLSIGKFPVNPTNQHNVVRWMAAEEPPTDWFHANNPLNVNASGSGFDTFPDLSTAALETAHVIHQVNMSPIAVALDSSATLTAFSLACSVAPWSTGGYHGNPGWIASIPLPTEVNCPTWNVEEDVSLNGYYLRTTYGAALGRGLTPAEYTSQLAVLNGGMDPEDFYVAVEESPEGVKWAVTMNKLRTTP